MIRLFFITTIFLSFIAAAQKKTSNNASSQQTEMRRQMAEANKEIVELEKNDPEAAKMARQMIAKMKHVEKPALPDEPLPKMSSPIVGISLKVIPPTPSLAGSTDNLFGYHGKKIDGNTLITSSGTVIFYNKGKRQLVVQPKNGSDPFTKIVKELLQTEIRKRSLIDQVSKKKNGFFLYPQVLNTLVQYDAIAKTYNDILKNTIDLPTIPTSFTNPSSAISKGGFSRKEINELPIEIVQAYEQVVALMKDPPPFDDMAPPSHEFDVCFSCDSNAVKNYEAVKNKWITDFFKYERDLNSKAMTVYRMISLLGDGNQNDETAKIEAKMDAAGALATYRLDKKEEYIVSKFGNDFKMTPIVVEVVLSLERQKQLLGKTAENSSNGLEKIPMLIKNFDAYIKQAMDERNYNVAMNASMIFAMERQKQLMALEDGGNLQFVDQYMDFNRFKLKMSMEFGLVNNDEDGKLVLGATGQMENSRDVMVSLGWNNCKFQLYLADMDLKTSSDEKQYRIPMVITGGVKKVKEGDKYKTYIYSGPRDISLVFPLTAISFCDDERDSAYIEIPTYGMDLGPYGASVKSAYTVDFLAYAMYMFFDVAKIKGKEEQMKSIGTDMMNVLTQEQEITPSGYGALDRMQADYKKNSALTEQQNKLAALTNNMKLLFLFNAQNHSATLIDETTDVAREVVPNLTLTKGKVKITVTHNPKN